jgi:hypothetical protein
MYEEAIISYLEYSINAHSTVLRLVLTQLVTSPCDRLFIFLCSAKWVFIKGTKYQKKVCVLMKFQGQTPQFGVIEDIILHNGPLFILEPLHTVCFNKHLHAYEVVPTPVRTFLVIRQHTLADYHPLGIYQAQNSRKSFVPLKYYVLDEIDLS